MLPQKRVAEGASSRLKSVPRVQKQRWEVVCLLRGWKPLFSELCWPRCCCCAGSWVGMCALQLARSWLRRAGLMYRERASVHGGYWKMQLVALPSAKSKAGNEQHLPRVSARYGAAAGSWRKESSLQGCLRTAAGLVDKSSRELGAELGVLSTGTLARAASGEPEVRGGCGCLLGPVITFPNCLCTEQVGRERSGAGPRGAAS